MASSKKVSRTSARRTAQANNRSRKASHSSLNKSTKRTESPVRRAYASIDPDEVQQSERGYYVARREQDFENEPSWNMQSANGNYSTRGKNEDYDYDEDDQEDENLFFNRGQEAGIDEDGAILHH